MKAAFSGELMFANDSFHFPERNVSSGVEPGESPALFFARAAQTDEGDPIDGSASTAARVSYNSAIPHPAGQQRLAPSVDPSP